MRSLLEIIVALLMAGQAHAFESPEGILAGVSAKFPSQVKDATNYWADILFQPDSAPKTERSLFSECQVPSVPGDTGIGPAELGLVFEPIEDGKAIGARFYKLINDKSVHYADLWDADTHKLMAHVKYGQESASGWQEVHFPPVPLKRDHKYVVSYNTTTGKFAGTPWYFTRGDMANGPLLMPAKGNGVFAPLSAQE
jgi:hypothetical protein